MNRETFKEMFPQADPDSIQILADFDRVSVGCVLLQAAAGTSGPVFRKLFGGFQELWEVCPTSKMRVYTGTLEQWLMFRDLAETKSNG